MKINAKTMLAIMLLAILAVPALAGGDIDEKRDVNSDAKIVVDNLAGSITVVGWDRKEVEIKGSLDEKADKLEIEGDRDDLEIKVKYPKKKNLNIKKGSVLEIRVPEGCRLELKGVSCDIDVSKFHGLLETENVSGDIRIVGDTAGITTSTVSGDVFIDTDTDVVEVSCISGYVEVRGVRGTLEVNMVSGEVEVHSDVLKNFSFNIVSGDLDIEVAPAADADWEINSHSGDITLRLPSDVSAEFDIEVFSGDIDNAFGPEARRTSKFAPGKELQFTAGSGSANIEISTFSGDIRLVQR